VDSLHHRVPRRFILCGARRGGQHVVRGADHRRDDGFPIDRGRLPDGQAVHRLQWLRAAGHENRDGVGAAGLGRNQFAAVGNPGNYRRRAPGSGRTVPLRAFRSDPGFRRQDRQARLGMGHGASGLERLPAQGANLGAGDPQQLVDQRGRREVGPCVRAHRQCRRRLHLCGADASGECLFKLDRRYRCHYGKDALELPDGQDGRVGL
jgi:hypothetical protein